MPSLCCSSLDRFISVSYPLRYFSLKKPYALRLVLGSSSVIVCVWALGVYLLYKAPQYPVLSIECYTYMYMSPWLIGDTVVTRLFEFYYRFAPQFFAASSILMFLMVLPAYRYHKSKVSSSSQDQKRRISDQSSGKL